MGLDIGNRFENKLMEAVHSVLHSYHLLTSSNMPRVNGTVKSAQKRVLNAAEICYQNFEWPRKSGPLELELWSLFLITQNPVA